MKINTNHKFLQFCTVFLTESDNESVPSPVKPQPRVPYCKTYEEIRLEEIQAESAAYYSYQMEDCQSDAAGDKSKARKTRRTCLQPNNDGNDENTKKGLDFEVLTLEEIRRRKRRKAMEEENETKESDEKEESTGDFLKDAIDTLAQLRDIASVRGVKRSLEEHEEDTDRCKIRCDTNRANFGNVPPVKLRRSPKRFASLAKKDSEEANEGRKSPADRLGDSESSVARRKEVEIRLCDSSTDETLLKSDERDSGDVEEAKESMVSCDSLLNVNEDEYLTLDMASDDILKDIDALLKEKSSV